MMQKKLVVVALAAAITLPLSALADSANFTFYGKADVSYDMVDTGDGVTFANGTTPVTGTSKQVVSSNAVAFTSDTTLVRSIWRILRCKHHNTLIAFTPALITTNENRRVLARAVQQAIAEALLNIARKRQNPELSTSFALPQTLLSTQSAYVLLLDPILNNKQKQVGQHPTVEAVTSHG